MLFPIGKLEVEGIDTQKRRVIVGIDAVTSLLLEARNDRENRFQPTMYFPNGSFPIRWDIPKQHRYVANAVAGTVRTAGSIGSKNLNM